MTFHRTRQRGHNRAMIGLIMACAVITLAVAVLIIGAVMPSAPKGSAGPPTPSPTTTEPAPVTEAQLAGLLLTVDEAQRVANMPHNYEASDTTELHDLQDEAMRTMFSVPDCLPAVFGGSEDVYRDSGMAATVALWISRNGWCNSKRPRPQTNRLTESLSCGVAVRAG